MAKYVAEFGKDGRPVEADGRLDAAAFHRNHAAIWAVLERFLAGTAGDVLEAGSGTEALQLLKNQTAPIDLMLTDVVMPDIHGVALAEQVRKTRREMKVLYASGYRDS